MNVPVRPAEPEDLPAMCALLAELFTQEAEFAPDAVLQERGLRMLMDRRDGSVLLVARSGGTIAGMVSLIATVSTAAGGLAFWLEDMVVAPGSRGEGIGAALMEAAVTHARSLGAVRISLLTDHDNEGARRFYGRHGFVRSPMAPMRLHLGDGGRQPG